MASKQAADTEAGDGATALRPSSATSVSSRTSSTVRAQVAAAEASHRRRQLELAQQAADRERQAADKERSRQESLDELQRQVLDSEFRAHLAEIEQQQDQSRTQSLCSTAVSERTQQWVQNQQSQYVSEAGGHNPGHTLPPTQRNHNTMAGGNQAQGDTPPRVPTNATTAINLQLRGHTSTPLRTEPTLADKVDQAYNKYFNAGVATVPKVTDQPAPFRSTAMDFGTENIHKIGGTRPHVNFQEPPTRNTRNYDSMLLQAVADTAAAAKALASSQGAIKKPDLPTFTGNVTQWLQFKRIFDTTKRSFSALENVARLQNALRGAARDAVASLLIAAEDPEEVMKALEETFARPELIVFQEVTTLKQLPRLGNDLKELGTLANRVRNSVATIKLLSRTEYLFSPELFHAVLGKLTTNIRLKWIDYATQDNSGRAKLEILSQFLSQEADRYLRFGMTPDFGTVLPTTSHDNRQCKRENIHVLSTENKAKPSTSGKPECVYCKKDHNVKACSAFKGLAVDDRWAWLREAKVCYKCLKAKSHTWRLCKVDACGVNGCTMRHHPLLHLNSGPTPFVAQTDTENIDNDENLTESNVDNEESNSNLDTGAEDEKIVVSTTCTSSQTNSKCNSRAFLKIVPVTVSGPAGSRDIYALLDDGSTATLLDSDIAAQIGVTGPQQTIVVNGVGGLAKSTVVTYVNLQVKGRFANETFMLNNVRSMPSLSLRAQTIDTDSVRRYPHLADLVEFVAYEDATPTMLIGADNWHLSISHEVRKGKINQPVACLTVLGWTLYGADSSKSKSIEFVNYCSAFSSPVELSELEFMIKEQYKLDSIGISKQETFHSKQDQRAIQILEETAKRLPSGRFEVGLPWKEGIKSIPDSYPQALSRFLSLERRMSKDKGFAEAYNTFIENMVTKEYAEECSPQTYYQDSSKIRPGDRLPLYLPHFGVYHPQKKKLRVVHDAAAKTNGISLNSLLISGPDLLQSLLSILFRFREGRVALTADIKEMFPQIKVREQDRDSLRYLWRRPVLSEPIENKSENKQPIKEFRMTAVIFGACCSPFIAQFIKNKNAKDYEHTYPAAAHAIMNDHYMDDYLGSHDTVDEAARLAQDIVTVHKAACFEMRGWISNDPTALNLVPVDLRAPDAAQIDLASASATVRVLGVVWEPASDNLSFRTGLTDAIPASLTKRKVLSHLMRVYDPLGLLGPLVVRGRILFQQAWRSNIDWDSELPEEDSLKWREWFQQLLAASSIKIPRWYCRLANSEPQHRELHLFSDASELAYACVAYWRFIYPDGVVKLALISSKARVSPLKPATIPRLELQAALMASRLALTIISSHNKKPFRTHFWTDSTIVLGWLRSDARTYKPFVAHRIGEIIENSNVSSWRWVPTGLNVADDATRLTPLKFDSSSRWFTGPSFLLDSPEKWPMEPEIVLPVQEECKQPKQPPTELVQSISVDTVLTPVTVDLSHFSNWLRLIRATARVLQVVELFKNISANTQNSRRKSPTSTTALPPLTAELMKAAERQVFQRIQLDSFFEEFQCLLNSQELPKNSSLRKLSPVLAEDKLLRLVGRIKRVTDIEQDVKTPILLNGKHPTVHLLVQHYHRKAGHANNETVFNEMRQKYWIIHMRSTIRMVSKRCLFCHIRKARASNPRMGDLPPERLAHNRRPFTFTGLDYFGPMTTALGRRREKRYVALFTCMTSRAVHLELVHSLSADSAIMAIRRFIARRGSPDTILSDNGTAFVGANRLLKDFYHSSVNDFAANAGINWKFIPPAAPFFGGCWERLVRSVKVALKAILNERAPNDETLTTLLMEAEAIVNSRPLGHISVDPNDPETLTPFHFLIGGPAHQILPSSANLTDHDLVRRADWRKALRLADLFWTRWVKEILPDLQVRTEVKDKDPKLSVGDVVIIVDGNLPRGTWPKGLVTATFPGKDGTVRVVDVATAGGTLRRPTRKLVKLPLVR